MKVLAVRITFTEEILGTKPANPDVFADFIASKAPAKQETDDELARAKEAEMREEGGTTVFHRDNGAPGLYDYQIKGFFKDACESLRRVDDTESGKLKAYKKIIDGTIFAAPRFIAFVLPLQAKPGVCERPLRAQTMQGERVALARSETLPAGSYIDVKITLLNPKYEETVREWLDYGQLRGIGQWRNSGKGRFRWEEI